MANSKHASRAKIHYLVLALAIALVFIAVNICFRPIIPIDETRYLSIAWEMWLKQDYLVPHINGAPYAHKPPLMFWLFSLVWSLFGTSETLTRLVVPIVALLNLYLVGKLAQKIYPDSPQASALAPLVLISFLGWFLYSSLIMFDLLLTLFVQLGLLTLWKYSETQKALWYWLCGLSLGLGMLTKGPVVFVYFLPFVLLSPLWHPKGTAIDRGFFKAVLLALVIAIAVILAWAVPAAIVGGDAYATSIFWRQTAGRIQDSFAHARPFYWYLLLLPALLFPWPFLLGFWRSRPWRIAARETGKQTGEGIEQAAGQKAGRGDLVCLAMFAIVLILFSCFSGKQIHYLLPVMPFVAIWIANRIDLAKFGTEPVVMCFILLIALAIFSSPLWLASAFPNTGNYSLNLSWGLLPALLAAMLIGRGRLLVNSLIVKSLLLKPLLLNAVVLNIIALLLSLSALLASLSPVMNKLNNMTEIGQHIQQLQSQGYTVSFVGDYQNMFGFAGRLQRPLNLIPGDKLERDGYLGTVPGYTVWIQRHRTQSLVDNALYATPYRDRWLFILDNQQLNQVLHAGEIEAKPSG